MPNGRQPLCDMSGIDEEIKDLVKKLNENKQVNGITNGVNAVNGVNGTHEIKTEDLDLDPDLPCPANAIAGTTTKWGIGKLHHVISFFLRILITGLLKERLNCFMYIPVIELSLKTLRNSETLETKESENKLNQNLEGIRLPQEWEQTQNEQNFS